MLAAALARYATEPAEELRELLLRDVLDVALGNTDNHARNTAVLKRTDGVIELTPLYDFAPMVLDPQGIARVCRWRDEEDGFPVWSRVAETLDALGLDDTTTKPWLRELGSAVGELPGPPQTRSGAGALVASRETMASESSGPKARDRGVSGDSARMTWAAGSITESVVAGVPALAVATAASSSRSSAWVRAIRTSASLVS